jgi:hypothetical protein
MRIFFPTDGRWLKVVMILLQDSILKTSAFYILSYQLL